jgi:hypothetical protein
VGACTATRSGDYVQRTGGCNEALGADADVNNEAGLGPITEGSAGLATPDTPPQALTRPSSDAKCLTLGEGSGLVSESANMSSVGQYMRRIVPFSMIHRMKW